MDRTGSYPKLEDMRSDVSAGALQTAVPSRRPDKVLQIYRDRQCLLMTRSRRFSAGRQTTAYAPKLKSAAMHDGLHRGS
jgi:hypothetical protein